MKKICHQTFSLLLFLPLFIPAISQKSFIRGYVFGEDKQPLPHASISVKNSKTGTAADSKGFFSMEVNAPLPLTLTISCISFLPKEIVIEDAKEPINIYLTFFESPGQEIIVGATRVPIQILQSPVSIEKLSLSKLKNIATPSYYDAIINLKGMDVTTSSLTYKTFSTRGFNLSGSPRVNQLVDGMDNQTPGLNFSIGSFTALTDPDVESVEVLPGASSVLYGAGGMNGTILINSKDPFQYPGLSIIARQGIMHVDQKYRENASAYYDYSFRWAHVIKQKLAFKVCAQYIQGIDWLANDTTNYERSGNFGKTKPGTRSTDPNYDGVNVYGDETKVDLRLFMASVLPPNHPLMASPLIVSRTGYYEKEVVDPETNNLKLTGAIHYKFNEKLEARLLANWGTGKTVYTGSNRFAFDQIKVGQYKLELRHTNWFINGYTTQGNAGDTYSATTTMQIFNETWKPSFNPANVNGSWYPQYTGAFLTALSGGATVQQAHNAARTLADKDRPPAGSSQWQQIFDQVRKMPVPKGGLLIDNSDLWIGEGQYNFTDKIKFAEVIAGFNVKQSILDSKGTVYIDTNGTINVFQWGAYAQVTKKLVKEKLILSVSGRYDKNENFDGHFTPRFTAVISPGKNHNIRISYQTAYRFPTNTDMFLRLNTGSGVYLLGGLPWVMDYMNTKQYPVYKLKDDGTPESNPYQYKNLKPETSSSFETGYKGLINNKLLIDFYFYVASYENFLGRNILYQPATANSYSIVTNSTATVKTYGWGISMDYLLPRQFNLLLAVYSDEITEIPNAFIGGFNTPKYRVNAGLSNSGFGNNKVWGFNLTFRWQDEFLYERDFATGTVKAFSTLDAQVNYKLLKIKSVIKLGATNLTNHYYQNAFGNPMIGGLYYLSYAYNLL